MLAGKVIDPIDMQLATAEDLWSLARVAHGSPEIFVNAMELLNPCSEEPVEQRQARKVVAPVRSVDDAAAHPVIKIVWGYACIAQVAESVEKRVAEARVAGYRAKDRRRLRC